MTTLQIGTTIAAILGGLFGGGGLIAWRRARIDIAGQLEDYWKDAVKREHQVHDELLNLQKELQETRTEAAAAAKAAADREAHLLQEIQRLTKSLEAARREVKHLRRELAEVRAASEPSPS